MVQQHPSMKAAAGSVAVRATSESDDLWHGVLMRVGVLVQFGCFLYILNSHGLSSTLCQGPSMMPTLNPAGDVVIKSHSLAHAATITTAHHMRLTALTWHRY